MNRSFTILALAALCGARIPAQMEKREDALYARQQFRAAEPKLDTVAPDLVLADLDGRMRALSSYRGRVVVLIKGGFT